MKSVHNDSAYTDVLAAMQKQYTTLRAEYEVNDAAIPKDRLKEEWWSARHQEKVQQLKLKGNPDLVFLGDSITQGWEGKGAEAFAKHFGSRKTLNIGFSGDRTEHVLWRLYNGEWNDVNPKAVNLLIGTNNTGQVKQSPMETAMGVRLIIDFIRDRSPDTKIILNSVFPRSAGKDDELRKLNDEVNRLCAAYVDHKHVFLLDMTNEYLQADGTLSKEVMPDLLHLNAASYEKWGTSLSAKLKELGL
jgi:N-acetylglucosamine-6-sulfatase